MRVVMSDVLLFDHTLNIQLNDCASFAETFAFTYFVILAHHNLLLSIKVAYMYYSYLKWSAFEEMLMIVFIRAIDGTSLKFGQ